MSVEARKLTSAFDAYSSCTRLAMPPVTFKPVTWADVRPCDRGEPSDAVRLQAALQLNADPTTLEPMLAITMPESPLTRAYQQSLQHAEGLGPAIVVENTEVWIQHYGQSAYDVVHRVLHRTGKPPVIYSMFVWQVRPSEETVRGSNDFVTN